MQWRNALWFGMCCLVVVTTTHAQGFRGPGPGGPRGPGFGGPGFGDPMASAALIGLAEVQQELKLTDEQRPLVGDVLSKMQEQTRSVFESFNPQEIFTLEEKERDERFAKMRTKMEDVSKQTSERLNKILDKQQSARFAELQLQRGGVGSLMREEIGKQLKLSDEQRNKLRELIEQNPPFPPPTPDQRKKVETDAVALLSDAQKDQWAKLKGSDFKFPEQGFGFGPPGGFGGPGGGPGGPGGSRQRQLVKQFDKDGDGRLNNDERQAARDSMKSEGGRRGGFGPPGGGASVLPVVGLEVRAADLADEVIRSVVDQSQVSLARESRRMTWLRSTRHFTTHKSCERSSSTSRTKNGNRNLPTSTTQMSKSPRR